MKKGWQKPTVEMLDVKMTMSHLTGTHYDADYYQNTNSQTNTSQVLDPTTGQMVSVPNVQS